MKFRAILRTLTSHQVEFIVVGGFGGIIHGSGLLTQALDIVHNRASENVQKLLAALDEMDAVYRYRPEIRPDESHLSGPGHQLLQTRYGWLDLLGMVGQDSDYAALLPLCDRVEVEPSVTIEVVNLETLIRLKEEAGRDKDRAGLPELRALLAERRRRRGF